MNLPLLADTDAISEDSEDDSLPFNPLSKSNLADSVNAALSKKRAYPLEKIPKFVGAGIYALYYTGPFTPYAQLTHHNTPEQVRLPIYLGKADPPGRRKGDPGKEDSKSLRERLLKHRNSIKAVSNLDLKDFFVRFLVVDFSFIGLCESLLINRFAPLWNTTVDGFGNNAPGSGRDGQAKSRWDTVHPGRAYAQILPDRPESPAMIHADIERALAQNRAISSFKKPDRA